MANVCLSTILSPPLHSPVLHRSISSYFTHQQLATQHTWSIVYQKDPNTNVHFENLRHHAPFSKLTIEKFAVTYRKAITQNLPYLINDRLVHLEYVTVSCIHICRIAVQISPRRVIFDALHTSPVVGCMG